MLPSLIDFAFDVVIYFVIIVVLTSTYCALSKNNDEIFNSQGAMYHIRIGNTSYSASIAG